METPVNKGTKIVQQDDSIGDLLLPKDSIYLVDSPYSEEFSLFLSALDRAYIVGMDAEWKPSSGRKAGLACPRVSIMQIACRLHSIERKELELSETEEGSDELPEEGDRSGDECLPSENQEGECQLHQQDGRVEGGECSSNVEGLWSDRVEENSTTYENTAPGRLLSEELPNGLVPSESATRSTGRASEAQGSMENLLSEKGEIIFLLDMLALPAWSFWEAMKRMLVSRSILKLGFRFKQDLVNLAGSFPGPDAHSCFDKVDPYVDVGKLYRELRGCSSSGLSNRHKGMASESLSLATVCEEVLRVPLCKDLQCSNWERRPLTSEQMAYAAADAHCLLGIYDVLETEASCQVYKDQEISSAAECCSSTGVGIAELLLTDLVSSSGWSGSLVPGSILTACHGVASIMVEAAVAGGSLATSRFYGPNAACSSSNAYMRIANMFGERLLVSTGGISKVARRKPKTRRGRDSEKRKGDQQEVNGWCGPPPWDPSCGGDGSPKFLCDVMVEGLARQLRNVGIDTACPRVRKTDPRKLVEQAEREGRVLLTRDIKLLRRRLVPQNLAYCVKSLAKQDQLTEVIEIFNLTISEEQLLSRCTKCNGDFIPKALTPEEAVAAVPCSQVLPEYALKERLLFWQCSACLHMYWQGHQFHRALESFQALARKIQVQTTQ